MWNYCTKYQTTSEMRDRERASAQASRTDARYTQAQKTTCSVRAENQFSILHCGKYGPSEQHPSSRSHKVSRKQCAAQVIQRHRRTNRMLPLAVEAKGILCARTSTSTNRKSDVFSSPEIRSHTMRIENCFDFQKMFGLWCNFARYSTLTHTHFARSPQMSKTIRQFPGHFFSVSAFPFSLSQLIFAPEARIDSKSAIMMLWVQWNSNSKAAGMFAHYSQCENRETRNCVCMCVCGSDCTLSFDRIGQRFVHCSKLFYER